jgi:8-oxo-dGTP pyrophosphatase MutT (NUDIX family)
MDLRLFYKTPMDKIFEIEKFKQPFDERLIDLVRGKRFNVYEYLRPFPQMYQMVEPICVQYNTKQRPTTSFGVAFYSAISSKWLVVEPKFTIEFISLMKGSYTKHGLPFVMEMMYTSELEMTVTDPSPDDTSNSLAKRVYKEIHDKLFYTSTIHILYETLWVDNYPLISSLARSILERRKQTGEDCMQAIFPKGRACGSESWVETAIREVSEETGIKINFDNPGQAMEHLNSKYTTYDNETNVWEPCRVKIQERDIDGYISKTHVTHTHSTLQGKLYRTVLWLCVINEDVSGFQVIENSETRSGEWIRSEDMTKRFRVQELYLKCESALNKYYPYLTL